ncbi:nitroreductase family protein [Ilumatobacter sp.]|uniref:nitroreductase family protein n=1 Tax=Ilumatobacter sp. TaxID=1967498 RepID=UPI002A2FFA6B|nr:nitroreductase family protein [Ilumatobacter sp.]MDG1390583.1 nitroreductase family protein [Ilumatobacter sp.]
MSEFTHVVRSRRMTRAFSTESVDPAVVDSLVDLASRAPSAGKTQGWHLVVLEGEQTKRFWDISLPAAKRASFRWTHLLDAPIIALPLADASAYTARYAEPDKARTGLGVGADAWPVPYWTIDTSMSVMTFLLAAQNAGLGALFFGVFHNEVALRVELGIPDDLELLGAIALGHRLDDESGLGRSSNRERRSPDQIIHRNGW